MTLSVLISTQGLDIFGHIRIIHKRLESDLQPEKLQSPVDNDPKIRYKVMVKQATFSSYIQMIPNLTTS